MKKLYYICTEAYDMVVSVDEDQECRYITETEDFPIMIGLTKEEKSAKALEFLETVEDDSSWGDDCSYEEIFTEDVEVLAECDFN